MIKIPDQREGYLRTMQLYERIPLIVWYVPFWNLVFKTNHRETSQMFVVWLSNWTWLFDYVADIAKVQLTKNICLKRNSFRSCSGCWVKSGLRKERKPEEQLKKIFSGPGVRWF